MIRLILLCAMCGSLLMLAPEQIVAAQRSPGKPPTNPAQELIGDWRGTSVCLVKPSACRDEEALYRMKSSEPTAGYEVEGYKIVDGKPVFMGTMECSYDDQQHFLHCEFELGVIDLRLTSEHLNGFMSLKDKTRWRRIELTKA